MRNRDVKSKKNMGIDEFPNVSSLRQLLHRLARRGRLTCGRGDPVFIC